MAFGDTKTSILSCKLLPLRVGQAVACRGKKREQSMKEYIIADKNRLDELYKELAHEIKTRPMKVQVVSMKGKTKEQLGYYWSTIVPTITKELNERGLASARITEADVNEILNRKFFCKEVIVDGEIQKFARSKSSATIEEMKQFIEDVLDYATNLGIFIPPPIAEDIL